MEFVKLVDHILTETREAPEGKHYTKSGNLRSGDADADGDGGPKFRSDPTDRKNYGPREDAEHEDGDSIRVETERHNHRGGVISRGVSTFKTMEDLNEVLPRMKELYHRILVNGKELGEDEEDQDEFSFMDKPKSSTAQRDIDRDVERRSLGELIRIYGEEEVQRYFQGEYNDEMDRYDENTDGAIRNIPEEDAEYRGRKVTLNKPTRGDVKKFKVYVKDPKTGNVKKVNFGHGGTSAKRKTMRIRKSNPKARKSFRARHKCDQKKSKLTPGYWSCKKW